MRGYLGWKITAPVVGLPDYQIVKEIISEDLKTILNLQEKKGNWNWAWKTPKSQLF